MSHNDDEDWNSYRRLVIDNQNIFRQQIEALTARIGKLELEIAKRAGLYGLLSGVVTTIVAELIKHAIKP